MSQLIINDVFNLNPVNVDSGVKRLFEAKDAQSPTGYSLLVRIRASHAGKINRNGTFYFPSAMQDAMPKCLSPYPIPWLLHHDDFSDPVGRIQKASYVSLIPKYFAGNSKLLQLEDDSISRKKRKQIVKDFISIIDEEGHPGLGYADMIVSIVDPDAIRKILDGTYLTVSTRQGTDVAECSICNQNWAKDGPCDHYPPNSRHKTDDGEQLCFLFFGDSMFYGEGSFVNIPADEHAQVIEILENDQKPKSIIVDSVTDATIMKANYFIKGPGRELRTLGEQALIIADEEQAAFLEDLISMTKDNQEQWTKEESEELKQLDEQLDKEVEAVLSEAGENAEDAKLSAAKRKKLPSSTFCGPNRSFPVSDCAHVTAARRLIGRAKVSESTKAKILACVNRKAKSLGCDKDKKDKDEKLTLDALQENFDTFFEAIRPHLPEETKKLSNEELDTLSDALFCGQNQTFLVHNKEYGDACLKLLEDYNCDETNSLKDFIKQAIDRLERAANAEDLEAETESEKVSESDNKTLEPAEFNVSSATDDVLLETFEQIKTEIGERDSIENKPHLIDREDVDQLQQQYDLLKVDLHQQDKVVENLAKRSRSAEGYLIATLKTLDNTLENDFDKEIETLEAESHSTLKETLDQLKEKVNVATVREKLATITTDDPTLSRQSDNERDPDKETEIREHYRDMLGNPRYSELDANLYLFEQIRLNIVPRNFKP